MNKTYSKLIIRADGSTNIGTGHLIRCLSLARVWKNLKGDVTLITSSNIQSIINRFKQCGVKIINIPDIGKTIEKNLSRNWVDENPDSWFVLDGYDFIGDYQETIKSGAVKLMVIDDFASSEFYCADILLNQNVAVEKNLYNNKIIGETKFLLGTKFALISPDFDKWRGQTPNISKIARRILIFLGGGDPDNQTAKVLRSVNSLTTLDLEIKVIVGPANPHYKSIEHEARSTRHKIDLIKASRHMPQLMNWADVAICAGGSTCWELSFMGVPMLNMSIARNQLEIVSGLTKIGASINLGWHEQVEEGHIANELETICFDSYKRKNMSQIGQQITDGYGCERVISYMTT